MSLNRLFETLFILMDEHQTTAKVLANHFEISIRTVYRDIDRLISAGFPIDTNRGVRGGIFLDPSFMSHKNDFLHHQEIVSVLKDNNVLQKIDDEMLIKQLAKLFNKDEFEYLEIDFNTWHHKHDLNNKYKMIKQAILKKRIVNFDYINSNGISNNRDILCHKLYFKDNTWYLQGYCLKREDYRVFRLSRISNIFISSETMDIDKIPPIFNYGIRQEDKIEVVLKFDQSLTSVVYDEFNEYEIYKDSSGYLVDAKVINDERFIRFLLSCGSQVKIIKPYTLKEQLLRELEQTKQKYLS